ncbi:MAG: hypothetical protein SGI92_06090 [Bryobacteraceae bacterium]|nr:hypothetical protein [Bryobacteraceae bacterium]
MKRILRTLTTTFLIALPCAASQLGSTWHGSVGASTSTVVAHLFIGNGCISGACDEFFTQSFNPSAVGSTFSIDANSYAGFANLASLLTNGTPDNIWQTGTTPQGTGGGNGSPDLRLCGSASPRGLISPATRSLSTVMPVPPPHQNLPPGS